MIGFKPLATILATLFSHQGSLQIIGFQATKVQQQFYSVKSLEPYVSSVNCHFEKLREGVKNI